MLKKITACMAVGLALSTSSLFAKTAELSKSINPVFKSGDKPNTGYHTFRIPTIVRTKSNSLLAFAEGRVNGKGDSGNIDIVMRRSKDSGKTWEPMKVVFDDEGNTCRNPCPVIDTRSGRIFLITTWSNKGEHTIMEGKARCSIYVQTSDDDGTTWSKPTDITQQVNLPDWWWYATGPASAIQIQKGKYRGRIVVGANHSVIIPENRKIYRAHNFYSDDLGKTWKLGTVAGFGSNESQVAELADGRLVQNMRQQQFTRGRRTQRFSEDGGATWSEMEHVDALNCCTCQGSIIRDYNSNIMYFSNPSIGRRKAMAINRSFDGAKTWERSHVIFEGHSAYSNLVMLGKDRIGILFECGADTISFARYKISDLFETKK